jgi:hypothetical protein
MTSSDLSWMPFPGLRASAGELGLLGLRGTVDRLDLPDLLGRRAVLIDQAVGGRGSGRADQRGDDRDNQSAGRCRSLTHRVPCWLQDAAWAIHQLRHSLWASAEYLAVAEGLGDEMGA